jgi:ATP-binding cassette subfamily B protein IrtA
VVRHEVAVVAVEDVTDWYRRVTCDGRGLLGRLALEPAAYLLLHVPDGAATADRAYTIAAPDRAADRFALDFVLHTPAGPASAWAAAAAPGMTLAVSDPPYHLPLPEPLERAVLIGDAAAAPALASLAAALGPAAGAVVLADPHPDRDLLPPAGEGVTRLDEVTEGFLDGLEVDLESGFVWAAGERALAKRVRAWARARGLARERTHIQT